MGDAVPSIGGVGGAPSFDPYLDHLGSEGSSGQLDSYVPPGSENSGLGMGDYLLSGLGKVAGVLGGFLGSFGCTPVEEQVEPQAPLKQQLPPPPTLPEYEPCDRALEAMRAGAFEFIWVGTASTRSGFYSFGETNLPGSRLGFRLEPGKRDFGHYPMKEGYMISQVWNLSKPSEEPLICSGEDSAYFAPGKVISPALDQFISKYAEKFNSIRDVDGGALQYGDAGRAPEELDGVLAMLEIGPVAQEISQMPGVTKRAGETHVEFLKRRFQKVGLEVLRDEKEKKSYHAIYHHIRDFGESNPPKFFGVIDESGDRPKPIIFVHNYNEDLNKYYLGPLKGAKALHLKEEAPKEEASSPNRKIIPGGGI